MANQLYLDFKIYHGHTGFSWDCVCLTSVSSLKTAIFRCYIYKRVKRDIKLCKYNMSTRLIVFELEFCIRVDQGNLGQSDSKGVHS